MKRTILLTTLLLILVPLFLLYALPALSMGATITPTNMPNTFPSDWCKPDPVTHAVKIGCPVKN